MMYIDFDVDSVFDSVLHSNIKYHCTYDVCLLYYSYMKKTVSVLYCSAVL